MITTINLPSLKVPSLLTQTQTQTLHLTLSLAIKLLGMRAVMTHDPDFNPRFIDKRDKGGKFSQFSKNKNIVPKNVTTVQYLIWGHGVSYATFKRWKLDEFKWTKHIPKHSGKSVVTDAAFAKTLYTAHPKH